MIYNPLEKNSVINVEELRDAAGARGIELLEAPVPLNDAGKPDATHLPELVEDLASRGVEFMYMGPDSFVTVNSVDISTAAHRTGFRPSPARRRHSGARRRCWAS